jgi:hypothetical protein
MLSRITTGVDVPQGDVDRRDGGAEDIPAREEGSPEEVLPDVLDARGILADEPGLEGLDRPGDGRLVRADARLPQADQAVIGLDHDHQPVTASIPERDRSNVRDLHDPSSSSFRPTRRVRSYHDRAYRAGGARIYGVGGDG